MSLREAFHPDVKLETPGFRLADDLDWLDRHRTLRAAVAVVLHAARILEALANDAAKKAKLAPINPREAPSVHHTLGQLRDYQHLSDDAHKLLDRLRDLGNDARHLRRRVSEADADQGFALALRSVQWYFCDFPKGPTLPVHELTRHNHPLDDLMPPVAADLLRMLQSADLTGPGFVQSLNLRRPDCPILVSPVLAGVLAEKLLDRKRPTEAEAVLDAALARIPDDVRLRQLRGLLYSRTNRLQQACDCLEAIEPTDSTADEETRGILAGAYKRRADAEPARRDEWLHKSQQGYADGWRHSKGANTYLGINAAALGLWLGEPGHAATARAVRDVLTARKRTLAPRQLTLWDALTLAEAHLLSQAPDRDFDAAVLAYREAARLYPDEKGVLEIARQQAEKHLKVLKRPELLARMFDA